MKYIRNPKVYTKKMEEKWYIIENDKTSMRELNDSGGLIWEQLTTPRTQKDLVKRILQEYAVEKEVAQEDVEKFLSEYVRDGYITSVSE